MRVPLVVKSPKRQRIVNHRTYPAPIGGWNAIDPLAEMPANDAVILENWFPNPGYCEIRGGSATHATGMTGTAKTIFVYNNLSGNSKMFCSTENGVYDVSSAGAVGASVAARTNGKHQWKMFGDGTNQWLIAVNGVDKPLYYDGTTWTAVDGASSPALTGITTTNLVNVAIFKGRLMFIANNQMAFWYLASGAAGGALTKFDLSGVAQKGGYLVSMESWTLDSGSGPDDRMVFVTSKGEVIVYQGTDPSSSTTWGLVGVYETGNPLGRRCIAKQGADLVILTQNGAFSINSIVQATSSNYSSAVSRKIENEFNASARSYGSNFGWKAVVYPAQSAVLVNIPIAEDGTHYQYAMNTITQAWCKFTGWDAEDMEVFNNELYYCKSTKVIKAWSGNSDDGANIIAYGKSAFNYFGRKDVLKHFKMFRPVFRCNGSLNFLSDIDVDFAENEIVGTSGSSVTSGSLWGVGLWGVSTWGSGSLNNVIQKWQSVNEWPGFCAAMKVKISSNNISVQWISSDYVLETGGLL